MNSGKGLQRKGVQAKNTHAEAPPENIISKDNSRDTEQSQ